MTKRRRIIVIGRDGQVARALFGHFSALDRSAATLDQPEVIALARPQYDLTEPAGLAAAIIAARPDLVINPAAYTAVDKAEDEPALAYAINAAAAGRIAEAAAAVGAPIIHFSTDYVFGGTSHSPYVETDAVGPLGVYGASKLAGEQAVAAANAAHVILRTAWICSPDGSNFLKTMLRLGVEKPVLRVVDDQQGSPTFAADLASAAGRIAWALTRADAEPAYGIFHCANAGAVTWCGFARTIMTEAAARGLGPMARVEAITTADYPTKARRPAFSKLATAKLAAAYGVVMAPWQTSLGTCLDTLIGPLPRDHTPNQALLPDRPTRIMP
jgi:dTDP-4-dehydrorhamnose reductase